MAACGGKPEEELQPRPCPGPSRVGGLQTSRALRCPRPLSQARKLRANTPQKTVGPVKRALQPPNPLAEGRNLYTGAPAAWMLRFA